MAEGNGEVPAKNDKSGNDVDSQRTKDYEKLLEYGLDKRVAIKLDDIYKSGKLAHDDFDTRALDALKEFPTPGALAVLNNFLETDLEFVSNKSAYLCGLMKTHRNKIRSGGGGGGGGSGDSAGASSRATLKASAPSKGPDEEKIKAILDRTGYTLDVTTGQRKYGGPPPNWEGPPPGNGCEVFCGKIPKDLYEDELILLFEKSGKIWDLRLMMDPLTGTNRGYAFVTYTNREEAQQAVKNLDNYEIKPDKHLKVNISVPNLRLFVGNIPKSKGKEEIMEEFGKLAVGLTEVIIYSSPDDKKKNRGFCFLEYQSHKAASQAKRRLGNGRHKVWGCDIIVDWADPQEEPDEETMSKVKVLYVRNLTQDCTEDKLKEAFESFGKVDRVKKIKDYAFVHFDDRDHAITAMQGLNGKEMSGSHIEVSLAKPPSDKKKKEEILRARERRMMQMMQLRGSGFSPQHPGMMSGSGSRTSLGGSRGGILRGSMSRGEYDYDYDYYGYGDYRGGYSDPYYDDFYRYEEYYYDYSPSTPQSALRSGGTRGRQPPPGIMEGCLERGSSNTGMSSGTQCGRGRGAAAGAGGGRAGRQGTRRQAAASTGKQGARRGVPPTNQLTKSLPGKRKLDGGHQSQGESKRRYQSNANWGSGGQYYNSSASYHNGSESQWCQDTYWP